MKLFISTLILVFLCSFYKDNTCFDNLVLQLNKTKNVNKLYDKIASDSNYQLRSDKKTFNENKSFEAKYLGKSYFKNADSVTIYAAETISDNLLDHLKNDNINLIVITAFFQDSTTTLNNYKSITENICKGVKYNVDGDVVDGNNKKAGIMRGYYIKNNSRPVLDITATTGNQIMIMYSENRK